MLHRAAQFGLVLCLGLVILAWGTSPCLFASMIAGAGAGGAAVEDCGCGCCEPESAPAPASRSGTDDCPVCSSIGNMHELPPVGAKVQLDAPAVATFVPPVMVATPTDADGIDRDAVEVAVEPPRVQFCSTVALLR